MWSSQFAILRNKLLRELFFAVLLPAVPFLTPWMIESLMTPATQVSEVENSSTMVEWASVAPLTPGQYYVSAGRPQGACSLLYGAEALASNAGVGPSERSAIFLGAALNVESTSHRLRLVCSKTLGSPVRLVHRVFVGNYRVSKFLHMTRFFTDQLVPIGIILFAMALAFLNRASDAGFARNVLVVGAVTVTYLISLGNTPRLLLTNVEALYIHSNLKILFLLTILAWLLNNAFVERLTFLIFATFFVISSVVFTVSPEVLFSTYMYGVHAVPIVIFVLGTFVSRNGAFVIKWRTRLLLVPLIVSSAFDIAMYYIELGAFFSPVSTVSIFSLALLHRLRLQRAHNRAVKSTATWSVLQAEERPLAEKMQVIGDELAANTSLPRWSIYLDSFSLGYASRPRTELRRLVSSHQHEHAADPLIRLNGSAPFGALMRRALETDSVITERSPNDNCLYVVIPILGLGCINLRGTDPSHGDERYLREYIDHITPQLRLIVPSMVRADDPSTLAASLLREELGPGVHQVNYGAIFADAVGYTQNTHISPHFVEFFQFEYIPALLRSLGPSVLLKDVFGDELFLIVREPKLATPAVSGSLVSSSSVENLTLEAVKRLQQFVADEGRELCTAAGYQAIEFKVGSHAGPGQISILGPDVTIVGPSIEAKRCLGRSRPSQPFISKYLYIHLPESLKPHAVHEIYAAKKEILEGYRVSFVTA